MKQIKHTPGPWHVIPQYEKRGFAVIIGPMHAGEDLLRVGELGGGPDIRARDELNAKLIAAAPDLLEACKTVHQNLAAYQCDDHMHMTPELIAELLQYLTAAIAKAEGREV